MTGQDGPAAENKQQIGAANRRMGLGEGGGCGFLEGQRTQPVEDGSFQGKRRHMRHYVPCNVARLCNAAAVQGVGKHSHAFLTAEQPIESKMGRAACNRQELVSSSDRHV